MKQTLSDIKVKNDEEIPILCDNKSAINISRKLVIHSRTKQIAKKEIRLEYVPTKEQIV